MQESGAENPRELPEGLGGVTIRSRGPEGFASACRRKGGHTNNQTLPLVPSGNSQGDSKMPGQLEDRNRTSSQRMAREKEAERERQGRNPWRESTLCSNVWSSGCSLVQNATSLNGQRTWREPRAMTPSPNSTPEPADQFRTLRDVYQLVTHTLSSPRKLGGEDRSLGQTTA